MSSSAVISIHSEYASRIYDGSKAFEFRRTRLSRPVSRLYLYETGKLGGITGYVNMEGTVEGRPSDVWAITKAKAGISYTQFRSYFKGAKTAYAYCLNGGYRFTLPLTLSDFGIARAPQSLQYVNNNILVSYNNCKDSVTPPASLRVFISGVHGVGKTTLARGLARCTGMTSYSSSNLIRAMAGDILAGKAVAAERVNGKQSLLLKAISKTQWFEEGGILDGHFTLLDDAGNIVFVSESVFEKLQIDSIIFLRKRFEVIASQTTNRDGASIDCDTIARMQEFEELRALEIAKHLKVPFGIVKDDLSFI